MDLRPVDSLSIDGPSIESPSLDLSADGMFRATRIAVVIPCYRVRAQILRVLDRIGPECTAIYVVDDACPEQTGRYVQDHCRDPRVVVIFHEVNGGVGAAVLSGMRRAVEEGADIAIKIDGDGQMDPRMIPQFVRPIESGIADYAKGNRFFNPEDAASMPAKRLFGNAALSLMTKASSGYWNIFDPTNGFVAISTKVLRILPLEKLAPRFFFESDMLFRLNTVRARVVDVPMRSVYGEEKSNLVIRRIFFSFILGNMKNFLKRVLYNYFLRDFSIASLQLVLGFFLLAFGLVFGLSAWIGHAMAGTFASTGTVMIASLSIILGMQFVLAFTAFDIANVPSVAIHPLLPDRNDHAAHQPKHERSPS